MTRPAATSVEGRVWEGLVANPSLTAGQRVCLSTAAHAADLATLPTDPADDPAHGAPTRSTAWYHIALGVFNHLSDTGAYRILDRPTQAPTTCRASEDRIRDWLNSPERAGSERSIAQSIGITDRWDTSDPDVMSVIENLISRAQQAGVFGVAGYTIHAHPVAEVDTYPDAHIITLANADGPVLATHPTPPTHLIDRLCRGVDAAVSVLLNTAGFVDDLRGHWLQIAAAGADAGRSSPAGRAFAAINGPTSAPITSPLAPVVPPHRTDRGARR